MTVEEIITAYLQEHGYDGLLNLPCECWCGVDDLMPCGMPDLLCESGYKVKCTCGEGCAFHIGPKRERKK